jgi:signal transduction histidine kinase
VEDIANDDALEAAQANKSIKIDSQIDELLVTTAGSLLWHAIDNLTRNAMRYTPEGTAVTITVQRPTNDDDWIRIAVRDCGKGVPEKSLDKIFNDFYRVESAREHQKIGGHGLGLSIANRAIIHHGGKMSARNLSDGFEIEVLLPASLIQHH